MVIDYSTEPTEIVAEYLTADESRIEAALHLIDDIGVIAAWDSLAEEMASDLPPWMVPAFRGLFKDAAEDGARWLEEWTDDYRPEADEEEGE